MKSRLTAGITTFVVGIFACISSVILFFGNYFGIMKGFVIENKNPSTVLQLYEQPLFHAFTFIVGLMLIVAAYGYFINRTWAFKVGIVATVIGLWTTWMLAMFPLMVGLAPNHMLNFMLIAVTFFVLLFTEKVAYKIMVTSFIFGVAYVMTFMNGNASLQKIIGTSLALKKNGPVPHIAFAKMDSNDGLLYDLIQTSNWIGAAVLAVVCIAVIYKKDWVLPVALIGILISLSAGIPVAYLDSMSSGELSMFAYGPIAAVIALIGLLVFREKLWNDEPLFPKKKSA